jgi:ribonuclease HIII
MRWGSDDSKEENMAAKYYADLNRKHKRVEKDWNECLRLNRQYGGMNFKSFPTFEEARAYLSGKTAEAVQSAKTACVMPADSGVIGSDEVGKIEPFKQMIAVAVYADPDMVRSEENGNALHTGDSKKNSGNKEKALELGKELTGFRSFDEIEDRVYTNEKYGLIYYIKIIPNAVYNSWEEKNTAKKRYGNAVLSYAHNEALRRVYEEVKAQKKRVSHMVIDDFISTRNSHVQQLREYTGWIDEKTQSVVDLEGLEIVMTDHAEEKFPDTVGAASNIGDYVDQLWHEKVIAEFAKAGIEFQQDWFDNFHGQHEVDRVFDLIEQKCGGIDRAPVEMKHTKYYTTWKSNRRRD